MRAYKIILISVLIVLSPLRADAVDTTIRVLVMVTSDADHTFISSKMQKLVEAWEQSSISPLVSIELIDGGFPYILTGGSLSGSGIQQILIASDFTNPTAPLRNLLPLRNEKGADIVILFTGSYFGSCGKAPTFWWNKEYNPAPVFFPAPIIDTRGSEDSYTALVSSDSACDDPYLVSHEFGHLFGGGHELGAGADGAYLYGNSHASLWTPPAEPGIEMAYFKTALARYHDQISVCESNGCNSINKYSDGSGGALGTSSTDNVYAINKVAFSVATYRETENNCGLAKPNNVFGHWTHLCYTNDPRTTRHNVFWEDSCPDQSDIYDVFYSWGGPSGPYIYGWSTTIQATPVVTTTLAYIKVEACNNSVCSGKSNSEYPAAMLCMPW